MWQVSSLVRCSTEVLTELYQPVDDFTLEYFNHRVLLLAKLTIKGKKGQHFVFARARRGAIFAPALQRQRGLSPLRGPAPRPRMKLLINICLITPPITPPMARAMWCDVLGAGDCAHHSLPPISLSSSGMRMPPPFFHIFSKYSSADISSGIGARTTSSSPRRFRFIRSR